MTLFEYLQSCNIDQFVKWLCDWSDCNEGEVYDKFNQILSYYNIEINRTNYSRELREDIILQGLESEYHAS